MLEVERLSATLWGAPLVDEVSFTLAPGQFHALIGESGSGKSMTAFSIMRLAPDGVVLSGRVLCDGVDLLSCSPAELVTQRGRGISMMLQEPHSAIDPVLTVEAQLVETIRVHHPGTERSARAMALELLAEVGLQEPERWLTAWPHQLSGGMRQRVLLACALAGTPKVLIADEPTTALDASVRMLVLKNLKGLAARRRLSVLLLTHDLSVVSSVCDEVSVMYAGRIVEGGLVSTVLHKPRHPYTEALMASLPARATRGRPLPVLEGQVPLPTDRIEGCRFRPRCAWADTACLTRPPFERQVACHHPRA